MNDTPPPPYPPVTPIPEPPEEAQPLPEAKSIPTGPLDVRKLFDALLRTPKELAGRLSEPGHGATLPFLTILIFSLLAYGLVLGSFAMGTQLWAAPLKITLGLLISGAICFPSLYIFFCLSGSKVGAAQLATCLTGALALGGLLLLGFAPAVWIFTQATNAFGFMGFLALAPWFIALFFGGRFLFHVATTTGASGLGPIKIWAGIFLLVTLQMTTSLRPILGRSDSFLTDEKLFFLQHWGMSADKELPAKNPPAPVTTESP